MAQYHWINAPRETSLQVARLCQSLRDVLGERLVGIYLHGSLAMGCFNPKRSDLDLLVVLGEPLAAPLTPQITRLLLDHSLQPHPIEISFLTREQLQPWRFPTPYNFHYGENWRQRMESRLQSGSQEFLTDASPTDPDLAAHFTILWHRGIVLSGPAIDTLFPVVPPQDYLAAIWQHDMCDCGNWIDENPVYGVLNLCRVLAYLTDGLIVSKDEGGSWAQCVLSPRYLKIVELALALYRGELNDMPSERSEVSLFDRELLREFVAQITNQINERINLMRHK